MRRLALRSLVLILFAAAPSVVRAQGSLDWRSEGPFLGNVGDLAIDPSHPDTVYAATHGGGVWRSGGV